MKKKKFHEELLVHIILIFFTITALLPITLVVLNSLKTHVEIIANPLAFPTASFLGNYKTAWEFGKFSTGFRNSILLVVCTIAVVLLTCIPGAYVLATRKSRAINVIIIYFMLAMTIPIQLFLFPLYYIMSALKLVGTVIPISFVIAARNAPLALFLLRTFFVNIPKELEEAARIDGASTRQVLLNIMLPLVSPGMITVGIIVGLNAWNEYLISSTFLQGEKNFTATLMLRGMMGGQLGSDMGVIMAGAMLLIVPILALFLLAQKYFIDGLVSGAVKG